MTGWSRRHVHHVSDSTPRIHTGVGPAGVAAKSTAWPRRHFRPPRPASWRLPSAATFRRRRHRPARPRGMRRGKAAGGPFPPAGGTGGGPDRARAAPDAWDWSARCVHLNATQLGPDPTARPGQSRL